MRWLVLALIWVIVGVFFQCAIRLTNMPKAAGASDGPILLIDHLRRK